jgi:hypothetical protein
MLNRSAKGGPDFGPCEACGTNNSHRATRCYKCQATLPWAAGQGAPKLAPATAPAKAGAAKAGPLPQAPSVGSRLPRVEVPSGALTSYGIGLLVFLACAGLPIIIGFPIAYFLTRQDSDYAIFAKVAVGLNLIMTALYFVLRMSQIK